MKERETKIGTFRIVQNDTGLTFYHDDTGIWYSLTPNSVEELKKFLTLSEKKEISYLDRTYLDKRRILRQLSIKDEIRNYVNIMSDKVWEKLLSSIEHTQKFNFLEELQLYFHIKCLLIDGYLAFEVVYNEKQTDIIDLSPIDPCSLTPIFHSSAGERKNDFDWIQHNDNEKLKRVLSQNQVIYISYSPDHEYGPTSYVEELKESYEKVKTLENELMASRMNLPGNVGEKLGGEIAFKQLKRADKKLQFMSKIPKSILKEEKTFSDDVRYKTFLNRICNIFETDLIGKLIELKNNL
jgi:hypothetical protein